MEIESPDYHDYVIKDGKLIGEFEQMYQKSAGIPWHQDDQESWIDVRLTIELLRDFGPVGRVIDYGCGLGYYLDILVRRLSAKGGSGIDISETAVEKARSKFPKYEFHRADLTAPDFCAKNRTASLFENGLSTLHVIRGTLWYVFPKIETVAGNLTSSLSENNDALLVIQNFPPLQSNFVGKDVIPNPTTLVSHFTRKSVRLEHSVWLERHQENANDSWFIGIFKKHG